MKKLLPTLFFTALSTLIIFACSSGSDDAQAELLTSDKYWSEVVAPGVTTDKNGNVAVNSPVNPGVGFVVPSTGVYLLKDFMWNGVSCELLLNEERVLFLGYHSNAAPAHPPHELHFNAGLILKSGGTYRVRCDSRAIQSYPQFIFAGIIQ